MHTMHTVHRDVQGCMMHVGADGHACTWLHTGTYMHTRAQGHTGRLAEQNQSRAASWGHRRQQRERQHPQWLHTDPNLLCLGLIWANAGHRAGVLAAPRDPAARRAQQPHHHLHPHCEGPALTLQPQRPCWQGPRRRGQRGHPPTSRSPPACRHRAPPAVQLAPGPASICHGAGAAGRAEAGTASLTSHFSG